ncbi:hypothetical protein Goshw_014218, partial [Gossypium schwendimanii]|nr:hypothetical protein [Gossypium schwendimanii]
ICFLDSLIDEAEDVKDLRDAGILYNGLGSDEEVAKLFNKMNTDLVPRVLGRFWHLWVPLLHFFLVLCRPIIPYINQS